MTALLAIFQRLDAALHECFEFVGQYFITAVVGELEGNFVRHIRDGSQISRIKDAVVFLQVDEIL